MEILFEILFELLIEGSIEISSNPKVNRWIRIPLVILLVSFFLSIIFLLLFLGFSFLSKNFWAGLFIIIIGFLLFLLSIVDFKRLYLQKTKEKEEK